MIKQFSNAGAHHGFNNDNNQDVISVSSNSRYIAITLADGVSTCKAAKKGALIACNALNSLLIDEASSFFQAEKEEIAEIAIIHILYKLRKQAAEDNQDEAEYSSTVSAVLVDKKAKKALLINLGDGIILGTTNESATVLAMPDDSRYGCCVTTTRNAAAAVKVETINIQALDTITICSDGAWKQMFDKNRMKPEVAKILVNKETDSFKEFLLQQNCFDDFSFVSVDLKHKNWRKSA